MRLGTDEEGLPSCSGKGATKYCLTSFDTRCNERYPLQYGMGEEAAELRLDLGGLGRVMCCVAGQEVRRCGGR